METVYLKTSGTNPDSQIIDMAAALIRSGEVVAFPTETVYGLGANALDEQAVQKIFTAKGRRLDNPLIVHVASWEQARSLLAEYPEEVDKLVEKFWPGPLTIVALSRANVPDGVRAGRPSVAVRMPNHPVALELIRYAGVPLAAPSANISGRPSPTSAKHVMQDLKGSIAAILDGGETGFGIESTIIDVTAKPFRVLRPGAITIEQLAEVIPGKLISISKPGNMKTEDASISHYRPNVKIELIPFGCKLQKMLDSPMVRGLELGAVIISEQEMTCEPDFLVKITKGPDEYGKRLYEIFRMAEERGLDLLIMETPPEEGLGRAIADRIRKAAGSKEDLGDS